MFAFAILLLVADAASTKKVYDAYVCPVRLREIIILRGASYLPQLLNYHVGQAWLTWFVSRVRSAPLGRVAGATLLVYATMFGSLFVLSAASWLLAPGQVPWLPPILLALSLAAFGYLVVVAVRPRWLMRIPAVAELLRVGVLGHVWALLWRLPHMAVLFLGLWLPYFFFGVRLSLEQALAYMPPLLLVGALPLTPQGVGTRDLIAVQLLHRFAEGEASQRAAMVAAATLSWACALTLAHCLLSPPLMRAARKLLATAQHSGIPEGALG